MQIKKYLLPIIMLSIFETVAVVLWLTKDNLFYLFNFSYIGLSISLGIFLLIRKYKHARRIGSKDIWAAAFWKRMVRICLLDGYGSGFSSLQDT